MPVVFVHGVPDTGRVWDPLIRLLQDMPTVALTFPGYGGTPIQDAAYTGTRWDLADWLSSQLQSIGEPVDVVAHDIGSVAAHDVIRSHPELIRSWVLTGVCDPSFHWHHYARIWQTTGLGEANRDLYFSLGRTARIEVMHVEGHVPAQAAEVVVDELDEVMFDCILAYYRSSAFFGDWELPALHPNHRGLLLWGAADEFQDPSFGARACLRLGVPMQVLPCGHWWQIEQPELAAHILRGFWADET